MLSRNAKIGLAVLGGVLVLGRPRKKRRPRARRGTTWTAEGSIGGYEYTTHQTGGLVAGQPGPPVIMFHGYGGDPAANASHLLDRLQRKAHVIVPRGKNPGPKWWDARAKDDDQEALADQMLWTIDDFTPFLRAVVEAFGQRPVVVGHSQGGMMAASLAMQRPALVREAVAASAWVPPQLHASDHAPITLVHGDADSTVPYARTMSWAESDPGVALQSVPGGHVLSGALRDAWNTAVSRTIG